MKKQILSLILVLCMVFTIMPGAVVAAEPATVSGTCGENVTWVLTEYGTLTISGTGAMTNYNDSGSVPWYPYRSMIETVVIESGVTTIGQYVFTYCDSLTSVTIPDSVTSIGSDAFSFCDSLTSVTIPDSVTSIGSEAFENCESLTGVTIGNGVTSIGSDAFSFCDSLTSVTIPDSVTSIGSEAFENCESLTGVTIGNGVTSIGSYTFSYCYSLTSVTIGNGVTSIGSNAFYKCYSLTSVTIPDSVTSIRSDAFEYCDSLSEITFQGDAPTISADAFKYVTANAYYPENNDTWTAFTKQNYGGTLTWIPYAGEIQDPTEPSEPDETEPSEPNPVKNPFRDVKESDYFYDPVMWAVSNDITSGMSATEFGPKRPCTRGHIVTFLWRAAGEPEPTTTVNPFRDVPESAFYYKAVLWAVENGITTGMKDGEFWPNYTCNRAQAVTFLYRAAGEPEIQSNANPFSDVKGDAYYCNAVLWAVENNVTNGMGNGKFEPNYTCTRGQIVTFLYRSFSK